MYEAFPPYNRLGHVSLYDDHEPSSMAMLSPGVLFVGLTNGGFELFDITSDSIKPQYSINNHIKIPHAGQIYSIAIDMLPVQPGEANPEIALATFTGLYFGTISEPNIEGAFGRKKTWTTTQVFLKEKMISQICQFSPGKYLIAEYSKPGYYILDRQASKEDPKYEPTKLLDRRTEHNNGCTNLVKFPLYDPNKMPYILSRNRYKIDLIDVKNLSIYPILSDTNTSSMTQKMVADTAKSEILGHKVMIYFNSQQQGRVMRCSEIDSVVLKSL